MQYSQAVLDLGPWSLSKAQNAINCPLLFRYKYIEKRQGQAPSSPAAAIGKLVHKVLEEVLKGERTVQEAYVAAFVRNELTTPEKEEAKSYAHNVQSFVDRINKFCEKENVVRKMIEYRFGFTQDGRLTAFFADDVFFRGVWDVGLLTANNNLVVIDHKTGEPRKNNTYQDQLRCYAVSAPLVVPALRSVQSAIHYVGVEEISWDDPCGRDKIESDIVPWFSGFLERAAKASLTSEPRKSWLCNFCEYVNVCPLKAKSQRI